MNAMLNRHERAAAQVNLLLSAAIFALGAASLAVSVLSKPQENYFYEFRYMTVNGTVFTTLISLIILPVYAVQLRTGKVIVIKQLYFFRLSAAVTECIIAVVILLSFFPLVPDNPSILSFDSFNMHVVIPLLSILSFLMSESPAKAIHPLMRLNCATMEFEYYPFNPKGYKVVLLDTLVKHELASSAYNRRRESCEN